MRIDAHHHLWNLEVRRQPWAAGLAVLDRSFTMADLRPLLRDQGVDGTLLVQTVTEDDENEELLAIAAGAPEVLGVVGWVDLTASAGGAVAARIQQLRGVPGGDLLVAIRHQVQLEPDPHWLLRADVLEGLRQVADAGLVYELLVTKEQLDAAVAVVSRVPGLRFVLDHAGKPGIAAGELDPWRRQMTELAAHPDVAVKLSGLVTEASPDWTVADLAPFADHLLRVFGPERVMAGTDWPVCLLRASYAEVTAATDELLAGLDEAGFAAVRGGTVARWYGLRGESR
jgi:L-fuconolactonase